MKSKKRILLFATVLAAVFVSVSCVTQRQVEQAITNANVAMTAPYLERPTPNATQSKDWEGAIAEMDKLIEAHPGQDVLVNQLRLRQAMLLTVNKKDSLAKARWNTINANSLKTERDRALFACHPALVWSYKRLSNVDSDITANEAAPYLSQIDAALSQVDTQETRVYLNTVRALIQLKVVNSIDPDEDRAGATALLATSLATFVAAFSVEDQEWVRNNRVGRGKLLYSIGDFRRRVWLRETIREYLSEAKEKNVDPTWNPEWVASLN